MVISLGGNKGDWKFIFESGLNELSKLGKLDKVSSIYKTEPWGVKEQPWFKNQIVGLRTELTPVAMMKELLKIEAAHGRNRENEERWGERSLDLDILLFNDIVVDEKELSVPHPRMHERRFILIPLVEIYPHMRHPILHKFMNELLDDCLDETEIIKLENAV